MTYVITYLFGGDVSGRMENMERWSVERRCSSREENIQSSMTTKMPFREDGNGIGIGIGNAPINCKFAH